MNRERKILEVSVDKGMEDGQKVTFSGEGDQEPGLEPGDIIIVLDDVIIVIVVKYQNISKITKRLFEVEGCYSLLLS